MVEVLVLGGSRFVGLHVVQALLKEGHGVTTLNRGTISQPQGVKHLRCDRSDYPRLRKLLAQQKFGAVVDISAENPEDSKLMIDLFDGRVERFIHCSTGAVYEDRWEFPVYEDDPRVPWTGERSYPSNKAECERLLFKAHSKTNFPLVILRPTVIYGPHNYIYREAYVFDRAEAAEPIPVPGDGKSVTHVVHVDDVADAFSAALDSDRCIGEAYNIAGPRAVTLDLWAESAGAPATDSLRIVHVDERKTETGQAERFPLPASPWVMSIEKARRDLRFAPRDLFTGMRDTYDWYAQKRPFGKRQSPRP